MLRPGRCFGKKRSDSPERPVRAASSRRRSTLRGRLERTRSFALHPTCISRPGYDDRKEEEGMPAKKMKANAKKKATKRSKPFTPPCMGPRPKKSVKKK